MNNLYYKVEQFEIDLLGTGIQVFLFSLIKSVVLAKNKPYFMTDETAANILHCSIDTIKKAKKVLFDANLIEYRGDIVKGRKNPIYISKYYFELHGESEINIMEQNSITLIHNAFLTQQYEQYVIKEIRKQNTPIIITDTFYKSIKLFDYSTNNILSLYLTTSYYDMVANKNNALIMHQKIKYTNKCLLNSQGNPYAFILDRVNKMFEQLKEENENRLDNLFYNIRDFAADDFKSFIVLSIKSIVIGNTYDSENMLDWIYEALCNYADVSCQDSTFIIDTFFDDFLLALNNSDDSIIDDLCTTFSYWWDIVN